MNNPGLETETDHLHCKYYFTLSFLFLGDLIQFNLHHFVRKLVVYVVISCFIRVWTVFPFSFQDAFQYVPLMQIKWRQNEMHFPRFAQIKRLTVFVYNKDL